MSDSEAGASHASDDEVLRRNLMMNDEGIDDQNVDARFSNFLQWLEPKGQRGEEIATGYEKLVAELDNLKLSSQRSAEAQKANTRLIEYLDKILVGMEKEYTQPKKEVVEWELELKAARKAKMNNPRRSKSFLYLKEFTMELERIYKIITGVMVKEEAIQKKSDERDEDIGELPSAACELKYKLRKDLEDWDNTEGIESMELF